MKELRANILNPQILNQADAICFTSNGVVKNNGAGVMGAGVAKSFRDAIPGLDHLLGASLRVQGNRTALLRRAQNGFPAIIALPTKHHWKDPSSIQLIENSVAQLADICDNENFQKVFLVRPGCANGGLLWKDVKPVIEPYLPGERFTVCWL